MKTRYTELIPEQAGHQSETMKPAPGGEVARRVNENQIQEHMPDIAKWLEQQKQFNEALWQTIADLEQSLMPILGPEPPRDTVAEEKIEAITQIGSVMAQSINVTKGLLDKVRMLNKRLEI